MKVKSEISFLTKVKLLPVWAATLLSVLFASCSENQKSASCRLLYDTIRF